MAKVETSALPKVALPRLAMLAPTGVGMSKTTAQTFLQTAIDSGLPMDERLPLWMYDTCPSVRAAVDRKVAAATAPGWKVEKGKSEVALRLISKCFNSIRNLHALLHQIGVDVQAGWVPIEWEWQWIGGYFVPVMGVTQPAYQFYVARDGSVSRFLPGGGAEIWTGSARNKWTIGRHGATSEPYGKSPLVGLWPLVWIWRDLMVDAISVRPPMGQVAQVNLTSSGAIDAEAKLADAKKRIQELAAILRETGIWANVDGNEPLSMIGKDNAGGRPAALEVAEAIEMKLELAIANDATTGKGEANLASAKVAKGELQSGSLSVAAAIEEPMQSLAEHFVELNGLAISPEDLPRFQLRGGRRADLQAAQAIAGMGGRLDAVELAGDYRVALAPDSPLSLTGQSMVTASPAAPLDGVPQV